ncbi:MAG: endonuclease III [Candidatus Coatesbacteria bacterium]|nr:endonuclease III [Candidatus Coatesbacteria bacterium]
MESVKQRKERLAAIFLILKSRYPDARLELEFKTPLDLLVASILAAQCTDERVNEVTGSLFEKYRAASDYANADPALFEREIGSIPLFRKKTRSIINACKEIVLNNHGEVPSDIEALTSLKGIGRKTANLVISSAFGKPAIVVDTHVYRISGRLGLSAETDRDKIEFALMELLPRENWSEFGHLLATFGRDICRARAPKCRSCPVENLCPRLNLPGD